MTFEPKQSAKLAAQQFPGTVAATTCCVVTVDSAVSGRRKLLVAYR